jgi:hypothetical protein
VKTRHWDRYPANDPDGKRAVQIQVGRLLRLALRKEADYERLIVIELAMPDEAPASGSPPEPWWMQSAIDAITETEIRLKSLGKTVPPTKVIICNHPHHLHLNSTRPIVGLTLEGMGPTDFTSKGAPTIRAALHMREKHRDILALWESIQAHRNIPQTFDGHSAHVAFGDHPARLIIGNTYSVPDGSGKFANAVLHDAIVLPSEKKIFGMYNTEDGRCITCTDALSDSEAQAYAEHPDTFFGVVKKQTNIGKDPLKLFDFFFESYGKSPKETLLKLMAQRPDRQHLETLDQQELAELYCEGLAYGVMARNAGTPTPQSSAAGSDAPSA